MWWQLRLGGQYIQNNGVLPCLPDSLPACLHACLHAACALILPSKPWNPMATSLQLRFLRSIVGLVSQEPTLFATTIGENIRFGKPGARCCRRCCCSCCTRRCCACTCCCIHFKCCCGRCCCKQPVRCTHPGFCLSLP